MAASALAFSLKTSLNNSPLLFIPSISSNPLLPPKISTRSSSSSSENYRSHQLKLLKSTPGASSEREGVPSELIEDSKFVPLNADEMIFGPPALLLLGFEVEEAEKGNAGSLQDLYSSKKFLQRSIDYGLKLVNLRKLFLKQPQIQQFLKQLDGEFLKVIYCTEDMITRSLWDAMNTSQPNLEALKIAKPLPRICFFSGLSGEEMMVFIDSFPESGLEPAIFAALVPNSADKPLAELIEEIVGDHEMLTAKEKENA